MEKGPETPKQLEELEQTVLLAIRGSVLGIRCSELGVTLPWNVYTLILASRAAINNI